MATATTEALSSPDRMPLPPLKTPVSFLRYSRSMPWKYDLQQAKHKEMLYRALNLGTTVAFVGAGCSSNFRLPDWTNFAKQAVLLAWYQLTTPDEGPNPHKGHYKEKVLEFGKQLGMHQETDLTARARLSDGMDAEVLQVLSILRSAIKEQVESKKELQGDGERPAGDKLRFILGACKHICEWCDSKAGPAKKDSFLRFLKKRFEATLTEAEWDKNEEGVHRSLMALPFHRFITSNYDLILEQFLARELGYQPWNETKFEKFLKEKAFTQADRNSDKLARFAAGVSENSRQMVFHCHGWYLDVGSMIVTEGDYQQWYLGDADGGGPAFRQTMELLVGSHPILFVGFGMKDPDLLMALRTLSATDPERKGQRSLFALLPEFEAKNWNAMERLFDQYGVHVIGYSVDDNGDCGLALPAFLRNLNLEWRTGRSSWLLKPKIHQVKTIPTEKRTKEYWHYELKPFLRGKGASSKTEAEEITLRELEILAYEASTKDTAETAKRDFEIASQSLLTIKPTSNCPQLDTLVNEINEQKERGRLVAFVGPGGSGKSFCAAQLVRRLVKKRKSNYKCFFWSSYYADDALTGVMRANEFFKRSVTNQHDKLSRLEVFAKHLEDSENVLVFDGLERFLRPMKERPDIGTAANSGVSDFLDILKKLRTEKTRYKATVVLTTRLAPELLVERGPRGAFFKVEPMSVDEAANLQEFKGLISEQPTVLTSLVALLDGHRYAMDLAALWPREQLDKLIRLLGNVGPLRHLERMIELTLCRLDQDPSKTHGAAQNRIHNYNCDGKLPYQLLMKRLAVFMGPIKKDTTFRYCHDLAEKEWAEIQPEDENLKAIGKFPPLEQMWDELIDKKLPFEIERPHGEQRASVMHAVVREFVFHNFHQADAHRLASFTQTGFTAGVNMVDPGKNGAEIIEELFCELRRQCREAYQFWRQPENGKSTQITKFGESEIEKARSLCQEAFGVLRSRMLANTVARWGSYTKYIHYLVRMGDLARAYCGMAQDFGESDKRESPQLFWNHFDLALCANPKDLVIHKHGPLFGDELAWLYHELGLALYHQGAMIDSLAIWEQGLEVNKFLDGSQPGQYTFQAYCNLGAACIQYGRLPRARQYLQMAKEISVRTGSKDKDHIPRLSGYLALVRHLRGDLLLADEEYDGAIKDLAKTGNARAECIFLRHRADLKLRLKEENQAANFIRSCRAKAEEGHFPDLVAHARLSEGHLFRALEKYQDAIREYKIALTAAKQYGMRGLEADVYCEMARLALDLGDTETARARAIRSLQIANELHLGLRQTHGLVVLGKATAKAGQQLLGVEYLKQARELAEKQHYDLRAREAEEELHRLGVTGYARAGVLA